MEGTPYYANADGAKKDTTYSEASHCYTFKMPEEDVVIDAIYKKVAVSIQVQPDTYNFSVTQTRTGNRKYPTKITEVDSPLYQRQLRSRDGSTAGNDPGGNRCKQRCV